MIMKKALKWAGAIAVGVTTFSAAHANDLVVESFAQSALTEEQKQAWQYYIAQESAQYGCQYGDNSFAGRPSRNFAGVSQWRRYGPSPGDVTYFSICRGERSNAVSAQYGDREHRNVTLSITLMGS